MEKGDTIRWLAVLPLLVLASVSIAGDCSLDSDQDGIFDCSDNCVETYNPSQGDFDLDEQGDHCDPNDGLAYLLFPDKQTAEMRLDFLMDWSSLFWGDLLVLRETGVYTQDPDNVEQAGRDCWLSDGSAAATVTPDAGATLFYLGAAVYCGSEGDLGQDANGLVRPNNLACHRCPCFSGGAGPDGIDYLAQPLISQSCSKGLNGSFHIHRLSGSRGPDPGTTQNAPNSWLASIVNDLSTGYSSCLLRDNTHGTLRGRGDNSNPGCIASVCGDALEESEMWQINSCPP